MAAITTLAGGIGSRRTRSAPAWWSWLQARNKKVLVGVLLLTPIVVLALVGPYLPIQGPLEVAPIHSLQAPSLAHPFGADKVGRDVFSRTIAGARISLFLGFSAALLALCAGVALGVIAGFMGRAADGVVMTAVDIMLSFPSLLLVLIMVAVFGNGLLQMIIAIAITFSPSAVRLQRGLTLGLKNRSYIDAANMASAPRWYIVLRHVLPNTIAPMLVVASIYAANAILIEASLSFLGLGIVPPTPSWGNIISDGRPYLQHAWWIAGFPGLALAIVSVSLHLCSDGIRQTLDPRLGV